MIAVGDGLWQLAFPNTLLALVALGFLSGQNRASLLSAIMLALGLLAGGIAVASAISNPPSAMALFALRAAAGLLVAIALPLPSLAVAAFALATGIAVMLEAPPKSITIAGAVTSQIATASGAIAIFLLAEFLASLARAFWQQVAVRVVASWIAASAILLLAWNVTR